MRKLSESALVSFGGSTSTNAVKTVHVWTAKFAKNSSPGLEHAPTGNMATTMAEMLAKYAVDAKLDEKRSVNQIMELKRSR